MRARLVLPALRCAIFMLFIINGAFASDKAVTSVANVNYDPFMSNIQRRIRERWTAPSEMGSREATIYFAVSANGEIAASRIDRSSGSALVDSVALSTVQHLGVVDKPPQGAANPVGVYFTFQRDLSDGSDNVYIDKVDFKAYMESMQRTIKAHWFPPKEEKSESVLLQFAIDRRGNLSKFKVVKSSGSPSSTDVQFAFDYNVYKAERPDTSIGQGTSSASSQSKKSQPGDAKQNEDKVSGAPRADEISPEESDQFWENLSKSYHKIQRQWSCNGYTFVPRKVKDGSTAGFDIIRGGKVVNKGRRNPKGHDDGDFSIEGQLKSAKIPQRPDRYILNFLGPRPQVLPPPIKLSKSDPPFFVVTYTPEGAHSDVNLSFFSLGQTLKKTLQLDGRASEFYFADLDGDGCCEILTHDETFSYWNASYAQSCKPIVILRYRNGKLSFADDLLKLPEPSAQYMGKILSETMKEQDAAAARATIIANVLELVYSGNAKKAWSYLDQVCEYGKTITLMDNCGNDKTTSKDEFVKSFKAQLSTSPYFDGLKKLNPAL